MLALAVSTAFWEVLRDLDRAQPGAVGQLHDRDRRAAAPRARAPTGARGHHRPGDRDRLDDRRRDGREPAGPRRRRCARSTSAWASRRCSSPLCSARKLLRGATLAPASRRPELAAARRGLASRLAARSRGPGADLRRRRSGASSRRLRCPAGTRSRSRGSERAAAGSRSSPRTPARGRRGADVGHGADQDQADILLARDARDLAADSPAAQRDEVDAHAVVRARTSRSARRAAASHSSAPAIGRVQRQAERHLDDVHAEHAVAPAPARACRRSRASPPRSARTP